MPPGYKSVSCTPLSCINGDLDLAHSTSVLPFPLPAPLKQYGDAFFVAVADVNGDRKPDLIATHDEDSLATLLLGDGDGKSDIVAGNVESDDISVLLMK